MSRGIGRGRYDDDRLLGEINVTPFIDVVLVLLIIFMITAAVVEFGLRVDVPPTTTVTTAASKNFNRIQISSKGALFYDGAPISLYDIVPRAKRENPAKPTVYVQIHRSASYEIVAQVLAECRAGGVEINLIPRPLRRDPRG